MILGILKWIESAQKRNEIVRQRSERLEDWHTDDDAENTSPIIAELKTLNTKLFRGFAQEISR